MFKATTPSKYAVDVVLGTAGGDSDPFQMACKRDNRFGSFVPTAKLSTPTIISRRSHFPEADKQEATSLSFLLQYLVPFYHVILPTTSQIVSRVSNL